jgi:hypothetical protein
VHDGSIEMGGKLGRLVEPASQPPPGKERNRDDTARINESRMMPLAQDRRQGLRE